MFLGQTLKKYMKKNKKILAGYTLIELLIVIVIIGLLSSAMLIGFSGSNDANEVEKASREVASAMREAQNYALAGSQGGITGSRPRGFRVSWSGSTYGIQYIYQDAGGGSDQTQALRSYTLRKGVTFGGPGNFTFGLPHANVSFGTASIGAVVTRGGSSQTVCVYKEGGLIRVTPGGVCP